MRSLCLRILRRSLPVALILAALGYVYGRIFLHMLAMEAQHHDPANEAVLYRTPLTMALAGVAVLAFIEVALYLVRGNPPAIQAKKAVAAEAHTPA